MLDLRDIPVLAGVDADALLNRGRVPEDWKQGLWIRQCGAGEFDLIHTDDRGSTFLATLEAGGKFDGFSEAAEDLFGTLLEGAKAGAEAAGKDRDASLDERRRLARERLED